MAKPVPFTAEGRVQAMQVRDGDDHALIIQDRENICAWLQMDADSVVEVME